MQAVVIKAFGGPESMEMEERAPPEPGAEEILVRVRVSALNRADLSQRRGHYAAPPGWPADVPGLEFAGTVAGLGGGQTRWKVGDRVMGIVGGGAYAEFLVTHGSTAVGIPDGLSFREGGAIPEVFMTAYDALFRQVGLGRGETVLIHAVGSGVGTAAVQLAKAFGARSIGTSRSREKLERARSLGLGVGVPADEGWPQAVLDATKGRGVEVVLDLVGGAYLEGNQEVLAPGGRHIVVGVPGGGRAQIDLRKLMGKRATLRGTVLRARSVGEKAELAREFEATVLPLFRVGKLRPVIDRTFAAGEVRAAHRRMEENLNFGKILLEWP